MSANLAGFDVMQGVSPDQGPAPMERDPGDDKLWVRFEMASHFDDAKTRDEGRPIFEMREYIKIIVPGDQGSVIHRPTRPTDYERFPRQYQAFKTNASQATGYPLAEWNQITKAQVDELAYFKVQTVEQLAGMSDQLAQRFAGLNKLREQAKLFLDNLKSEAPVLRMQAELATRDEQISTLQSQLKQMQEMMDQLRAEAPVKKGR